MISPIEGVLNSSVVIGTGSDESEVVVVLSIAGPVEANRDACGFKPERETTIEGLHGVLICGEDWEWERVEYDLGGNSAIWNPKSVTLQSYSTKYILFDTDMRYEVCG